MSVEILFVSKRPTGWVRLAMDDYLGRFPDVLSPKIIYVSPETGRLAPKERLARESRSILAKVRINDVLIALDVTGRFLTNENLNKKLKSFSEEGKNLKLVVGGVEGLDGSVKERAHESWSLSGLILPHQIVQILLIEQLYRAFSISVRHPYHRS